MSKDPLIFVYMSDELGESAREETLAIVEQHVFDEGGDYRDLMLTQDVWIDRRLASIYNLPAPSMDGFGWTTLPDEDRRRGLFGQVSFLALQAHAVSTSVTLRGLFVRENLLCQSIPLPPADLNTSIPEASDDLPTMRDRVEQHMTDPTCSGCHQLTDPLGLGLENFDGIGRWRTSENGVAIDASGDLNGETWTDAWGLAEVVRNHQDLGPCLSDTLFEYAAGHVITSGEAEISTWHADGFAQEGYSVLRLVRELLLSPAFRQVGEVEP
jgi:hypothetical protein